MKNLYRNYHFDITKEILHTIVIMWIETIFDIVIFLNTIVIMLDRN